MRLGVVGLAKEPDGLVGIVGRQRVVESADDVAAKALKVIHGASERVVECGDVNGSGGCTAACGAHHAHAVFGEL